MTDTQEEANGTPHASQEPVVSTDLLIVGAGPAGASLACFLGSHGLTGLIISTGSSSSETPRAHITNQAALECLRDIGIEEECLRQSSHGDTMMHTRWAHSMAGREYARLYSWGNNPKRKGEYEAASPCRHVDLPQTLLEPVLLRYATQHGFQCRMNTKFLSLEQDEKNSTVTTTVLDKLTNQTYNVRSRFLFGADGARSAIVKQLGLPLDAKPGQGIAMDFLVKTDLSHLVKFRTGNLHWLIQPDVEHPAWGWLGVARMVKPWTEWIFTMFPSLDYDPKSVPEPSEQDYLKRIKEFIGDDTSAEVLKKSKWYINEIVAKEYSKGNVICLGDAVHRHPPMNGLGSNTCIQDSFNLAWKVAYVLKGLAKPSLLATYTPERQPVGTGIISRANDSYRNHRQIWDALGILSASVNERKAALEELSSPSAVGNDRRRAFRAGIEHSAHEFHALGIEMNQRYESSAIYTRDEACPFQFEGPAKEDPVLNYVPNTYPGSRLPHAWLNQAIPVTPISTIDLAGKGAWAVITGVGGAAWKAAAVKVGQKLDVDIQGYSIGFGQDWEDVYYDWEKVRGVQESGCVLVRPDRFVAWRAADGGKEEEEARLLKVMRTLLGLGGP